MNVGTDPETNGLFHARPCVIRQAACKASVVFPIAATRNVAPGRQLGRHDQDNEGLTFKGWIQLGNKRPRQP